MNKNLLNKPRTKYLITGATSFTAEYLAFIALNLIGIWLLAANSISFTVGLVISFYLNKRWTFSGEHILNKKKQFSMYLALSIINLFLLNSVVIILFDVFSVNEYLAKVISMGVIIISNYFIFRRVIFKLKD